MDALMEDYASSQEEAAVNSSEESAEDAIISANDKYEFVAANDEEFEGNQVINDANGTSATGNDVPIETGYF